MRIGRVLLIFGIIVLVAAALLAGFVFLRGCAPQPAPTTPPEIAEQPVDVEEPPERMVQIVVAAQNIPRGFRITADNNAVMMMNWPMDAAPPGVISDLEAVYDRYARVDIVLGAPLVEGMLTDESWDMVMEGSEAALRLAPGTVAYAVPVARYSGVAWALRPGDRVDVILSLLMADLDEEFQSLLLNQARCLASVEEDKDCGGVGGPLGRLEVLPNGWLVNVTPSEDQRARLVTQLTLQNVQVLHVGDWPTPEEEAQAEQAAEAQAQLVEGEPTPVPARPDVLALTVAVTQQDALVLEYAQAVGARFTFVLRSAGDTQSVATESVTLQYLMQRFNIELPPKLPYGVTPPLVELARVGRDEIVGRYGGGEAGGGQ